VTDDAQKDESREKIFREATSGKYSQEEFAFLFDNRHFVAAPVSIEKFVLDPAYLDCPQIWPEVRNLLGQLFEEAPNGKRLSAFAEFVLAFGIGGGKSTAVSCMFVYVVYWLLCLKDPQSHFGLVPKSAICIINTSTTATQAKRVVFGEMLSRVEHSPWFQTNAAPDPSIRSELRFPKNIVIFPGSSSETAPIGYNIFMAVVDEASFFIATDVADYANRIYTTLERRITSRFGDRGLIGATSSLRYVDDFTCKKYDASRTDDKIFGLKRPTWEMRPDDIKAIQAGECFELKHSITRKMVKIPNKYKRDFDRDSKKAWRDFGSVASLTLEAYFTDEEIRRLDSIIKNSKIPAPAIDNRINPAITPKPGAMYSIHIDLGIVRDACGFALAHDEPNGKVIIDLALRITTEKRAEQFREKGERVDIINGKDQVRIDDVVKLVYELGGRGFPIRMVSFDGFQSIHSRQQLEDNQYPTDLISVDRNTEAYDTFKSLINTGKLECNHPMILHEAKRLELIKGKKVDHAQGSTKDVDDAVAGVCASIAKGQGDEVEDEETIVDESARLEITEQI